MPLHQQFSQLPLMRHCFSTFSQQHHPPVPGPFCLPCPMLVIAWLNVVPSTTLEWVFTFRTKRFALAYTLFSGLECLFTAPPTPALDATIQLILLATTRLAVGANRDRITMHNAVRDVILIVLPNLLPCLLLRKCLSRPADVFLSTWSCSWPAALDVHVISPFNNRLWEKLHPLLAMSCKLVLSASFLPTSRHAD